MVRAASALLIALLAACSGAGAQTPAASSTSPSLSATPASTVSTAGPWTFTVDSSSKTTVRVREVLAQIRAPGDAILTATGMKGTITLDRDGSFTPSSKITADLTTLKSDSGQRDSYIKDNTLETRRFPSAELVPTRATGLTLPLPASGEFKFTMTGKVTVHGVTKDMTFAVTAKRDGARLTATATNEPAWKFGDFNMAMPRVASVLSIEDDIRIEVSLVATETG
jgi:polyisoprenoid-binding protein YceI